MTLTHTSLLASLESTGLEPCRPALEAALSRFQASGSHGRAGEWDEVLASLPDARPGSIDLAAPAITIGTASDMADPDRLEAGLRALMPWRKGPFQVFGTCIDAEWRSDWKWARLLPHISPLAGRKVLDIGCGNGYYMLRALGEGANCALGVDPTLLFAYQFAALRKYASHLPAWILPLRGEDVAAMPVFDTVFSMGVLHHHRSPLDHLSALLAMLRPGGELVLETLVVEGGDTSVLMPADRYARMRNIWFLPAPAALERWAARCGFSDLRTVDVTVTTTDEQRGTPWMTFQSLPDFLMPGNPSLTVEGLPAPRRAIVIARR